MWKIPTHLQLWDPLQREHLGCQSIIIIFIEILVAHIYFESTKLNL